MMKLSFWIVVPALLALFVGNYYMVVDGIVLFFILSVAAFVCATLPWLSGKPEAAEHYRRRRP